MRDTKGTPQRPSTITKARGTRKHESIHSPQATRTTPTASRGDHSPPPKKKTSTFNMDEGARRFRFAGKKNGESNSSIARILYIYITIILSDHCNNFFLKVNPLTPVNSSSNAISLPPESARDMPKTWSLSSPEPEPTPAPTEPPPAPLPARWPNNCPPLTAPSAQLFPDNPDGPSSVLLQPSSASRPAAGTASSGVPIWLLVLGFSYPVNQPGKQRSPAVKRVRKKDYFGERAYSSIGGEARQAGFSSFWLEKLPLRYSG